MSISFLDHPAEREGLIHVNDSLTGGAKAKSLDQVQYVFVDPHGSMEVPPVAGLEHFLGGFQSDLLQAYFQIKRDAGIPELSEALEEQLPNSIRLSFGINRALTDSNRQPRHALGPVLNRAPADLKRELLERHIRAGRALDTILAQVPGNARISLLHSTVPFESAWQLSTEDLRDPAVMRKFLEEEDAVGPSVAKEYKNCFITGDLDGKTHGDRRFRLALQRQMDAEGLPYASDDPYATELGKHMTSSYMLMNPGRVNAVDWRKDELLTGSVEAGTFSSIDSDADPKKIARIAGIFAEALREVSSHPAQ